jgi:hypothetical protein
MFHFPTKNPTDPRHPLELWSFFLILGPKVLHKGEEWCKVVKRGEMKVGEC